MAIITENATILLLCFRYIECCECRVIHHGSGRVILVALVVVLVLGAVTAQNEDERVAYSACFAQCEADRGPSGSALTTCEQQCDHDLHKK